MLKDKASLCEKVAALQRRLESQSIAAEHKLQNEIQRIKETALAAEKIRRERWVRENTKKIKVNDTNQKTCDFFLNEFLNGFQIFSHLLLLFFCFFRWIAFSMRHCLSVCLFCACI